MGIEVDVDFDRDGNPEGAALVPWFIASSFTCRACGLRLDGGELVAAGISGRWIADNYEPDPRECWGCDDRDYVAARCQRSQS